METLVKKCVEERNDSFKSETQKEPVDTVDSNENTGNVALKAISKFVLDGVYLSETGFNMVKSQILEQPKKTRIKRKIKEELIEESVNIKEIDENLDDDPAKLPDDDKKKRHRRLRLDKLGIGGFTIRHRGRLSSNKEEDETSQDNLERSLTPDNGEKPRRRRRSSKKKKQLQDQYPVYMQEAFFGTNLLDAVTTNGSNSDLNITDKELSDDEKLIDKDKIVNLPSELAQNIKKKDDDLNFFDANLQENFENFSELSPDTAFVHYLCDETIDKNDLNDLENSTEKNDDESKIVMDEILESDLDFIESSILPQMDSQDVENIFEVMSNNSNSMTSQQVPQQIATPKDYPTNDNPALIHPKTNIEPLDLPLIPNKSDLSDTSTPVTPLSSEALTPMQQQFSTFESNPVVNNPYIASKPVQDTLNQSVYYMPEPESETSSQGPKNFAKWESEEALGKFASISAVLYVNINHPNLKIEFPIWSDRLKQIHKLWRQLSPEQRQPYLQAAKDNRSANKKNQGEMVNKKNLLIII